MVGETRQGGEEPDSTYEFQQDGDTLYVSVIGDADLYNTPELKAKLVECINHGEIRHIVMDLSGATFTDSTFNGIIVSAQRRLRGIDGDVGLVGMNNPNIRKMFALLGFDRIFPYLDEQVTGDPAVIMDWAKVHSAQPAIERYWEEGDEHLAFIFPTSRKYPSRPLDWPEFFEHLGDKQVRYQPQPPAGIDHPFYTFEDIPSPQED